VYGGSGAVAAGAFTHFLHSDAILLLMNDDSFKLYFESMSCLITSWSLTFRTVTGLNYMIFIATNNLYKR
jgi:hypothetical protein